MARRVSVAFSIVCALGLLVAAGGAIRSPLLDAAKSGDKAALRALLAKGATVNAPKRTAPPRFTGPATGTISTAPTC